jgi:acyl carrier protein
LSIDRKLAEAVSRAIECPVDEISAESGIGETTGWDSFGHLRVILELEAEYSIRFDMNRIPELKTVDLIQQELRNRGAV